MRVFFIGAVPDVVLDCSFKRQGVGYYGTVVDRSMGSPCLSFFVLKNQVKRGEAGVRPVETRNVVFRLFEPVQFCRLLLSARWAPGR